MQTEYLNLFIFCCFLFFIVAGISILAFLLNQRQQDPEKLSAYECGFNPFETARQKFEIHFYLVAMLFILFDVEVALLFPFVLVFSTINLFGFLACIYFLLLLALGFIYEWLNDALTWY